MKVSFQLSGPPQASLRKRVSTASLFYNFFRIEHLKPLQTSDVEDLFDGRARVDDRRDLEEQITSHHGAP